MSSVIYKMKQYYFYKISLCDNTDFTYIGYTTNFTKRKHQHKKNLNDKTKINFPLYRTINENGGWDNVYMGLLEYGEYESLKDVYIRERELIDLHKTSLNGHLPSKIAINFSENPKEYKVEWHKDYKQNNPEEYKEKLKRQNETRKEKKAEWHQQNKDKINAKGKEKVICDVCNKEMCRSSLWHHKKTHKSIP
jgi:hypothetical protein